jgi:hypothetical protein
VEMVANMINRMETPPEVKELLLRIKQWRDEQPGRHAEIAKALGVNERVLSNWLNLHKNPSLNYWIKLVKFARDKRIRRK